MLTGFIGCVFVNVCSIFLLFRLEPDKLWCSFSEREGAGRHDSSHRAPTPLSSICLFLRSGRGVCSCDVICRLLHPFSQFHVCEEHLSARLQAVSKYTCVIYQLSVQSLQEVDFCLVFSVLFISHNPFSSPLRHLRHLTGRSCG